MKNKTLFPIILLVFLGFANVSAQSNSQSENFPSGKTSLFFEIGGSSWLYSINIDHKIHPNFSLRGGLAALATGDFSFLGAPILVNALHGQGSHRFEIGVGTLLGSFSNHSNKVHFSNATQAGEKKDFIFLAFNTGYRYQPINKKLFVRVAYTPFVTSEGWQHWAGIGIGFTLSK